MLCQIQETAAADRIHTAKRKTAQAIPAAHQTRAVKKHPAETKKQITRDTGKGTNGAVKKENKCAN